MINNEDLKLIAKDIARRYKNDASIQYLYRSIIHSRDWVGITAGFSTLNNYMQETYGFALI